ncbi:MAG: hypothetical protein KGD74_06145 [Candidatus Lokiarchaeota archaeon]|nr:hypothetical protein [Candidatus Lokiarchaeota archaeon]
MLALGAIMQIISIVLSFDRFNPLLSAFSLAFTAISIASFTFYGYKIKNFLLIVFAVFFFAARVLFLLIA